MLNYKTFYHQTIQKIKTSLPLFMLTSLIIVSTGCTTVVRTSPAHKVVNHAPVKKVVVVQPVKKANVVVVKKYR
ncbi:hypothetical protein [uncultured Shewanella sp.]|uniref:hypothetical protein n=1 Tax=uncultured Shewanella sp. TaxID=173975 RepID=UPI00260918FE|nr:hypothetical protein [uncultured Shewanella sp.]